MSAEQLLREFEAEHRVVLGDLEAGVGTLLRMGDRAVDLALVVTQPTAKAMEVARRGLLIAASRAVPAVLVANRVTSSADEQLIRDTIKPDVAVFVVPDDAGVTRADEDGMAPLDVAARGPAVVAIEAMAERIMRLAAGQAQAE